MIALVLTVSGRVQGVSFRWSVRQQARREGVNGYARNLDDGRVEVWLEGEADAVERVAAYCGSGPEGASVSAVEREDCEPAGRSGFTTG